MTDDQIKELISTSIGEALKGDFAKTMNDTVNGAISKMQKDVLPGILKSSLEGVTKQFGDQFTALTDNLANLQTTLTTNNDGKGKGSGDKKDDVSPEVKAMLQKLEKSNADLAKKLEDEAKKRETAETKAKQTDKESQIRSLLNSEFAFATPEAAEDAFSLVSGKIDFDPETGKLVADGLPFGDFVKDFIPTKKPYLLSPKGKGGAGSEKGGVKGSSGAFTLEQIKPGMSQEDMVKAAGSIKQALVDGGFRT
jgi:hypothetical protein